MAIASDAWLATVARRLEALASSVVFVGGATISLLIDDPASAPVRPTDDLDAIIEIATAPYFIAMKLEAFSGRGQGDYVASHDLEDIVAIVDGRGRVVTEIEATDDDLRHYLVQRFRALLATSAFVDAIPGHLAGDAASQARLPLVMDRLRRIAGAS